MEPVSFAGLALVGGGDASRRASCWRAWGHRCVVERVDDGLMVAWGMAARMGETVSFLRGLGQGASHEEFLALSDECLRLVGTSTIRRWNLLEKRERETCLSSAICWWLSCEW